MKWGHRFQLPHLCDIQRADIQIDTSAIRDRRVAKYDTVASDVRCWFEQGISSYQITEQLGQIAVKTYTVHFLPEADVREGDRLLKDGVYYLVENLTDNTSQGFHKSAQVTEKKYAMA